MNSKSLFCAVTVLSMVAGCTVAAEEGAPTGESESAVTEESANGVQSLVTSDVGIDLFASPDGLKGCERVTNLVLRDSLLPTYPVQIVHTATISWSYQGCTGPVPALYQQPETFAVTETNLGCGSQLLRGERPSGASFEIFDHRRQRRGLGLFCGPRSVNPIIVRTGGKLLYSAQR